MVHQVAVKTSRPTIKHHFLPPSCLQTACLALGIAGQPSCKCSVDNRDMNLTTKMLLETEGCKRLHERSHVFRRSLVMLCSVCIWKATLMGVVNTPVLGPYKHDRFQSSWWTTFHHSQFRRMRTLTYIWWLGPLSCHGYMYNTANLLLTPFREEVAPSPMNLARHTHV